MGVLRSTQSLEAEFAEMLLRSGGKDAWKRRSADVRKQTDGDRGAAESRTVCVTGATSYVGFAVVNRLLDRGYTVRVVLETQEDLDKLREMDLFGELGRDGVWAVMASPMDVDGLCRAFDGCTGVFHTSILIDPQGISGYSKYMATTEVKAAEQVIEACVRTGSVSKCVFTSSLLACVWRQDAPRDRRRPTVVDENCWSDETLCRDKKLWYALGKTMAEKAAWRAARGRNLKLVTLCPALVTGPGFRSRNSTGSVAYFKGADEMFGEGLLATADVAKVADAHVAVYEAMSGFACGRYICYDHVVRRSQEAAELERQLGLHNRISHRGDDTTTVDRPFWFELSNGKLTRLMTSSRRRCNNDSYSIFYS